MPASETPPAAQLLHRLLRALASVGVFAPTAESGYALTPMAECLRTDAPGSLRAVATMYGEPWHRAAWSAFHTPTQSGGTESRSKRFKLVLQALTPARAARAAAGS